MLHSVYDQPEADLVAAQFDKMLDQLTGPLPAVAAHLDAARADVLAFTAFPKDLWRQVWSNNLGRAPQPQDPPAHRRRGHLPRPQLSHPPGRSRARRTTPQSISVTSSTERG
jgi:transposase-like protein